MKLSHSEASSFEKCRLKWLIEFGMRLKPNPEHFPESKPLTIGSLAHLLVETAIEGGDMNAVIREDAETNGLSEIQHRAWTAAQGWLTARAAWAGQHFLEAERVVARDDGEVSGIGQIDITATHSETGMRTLVDLKTTGGPLGTALNRYENSRQLMFYDWLDGCRADYLRYDVASTSTGNVDSIVKRPTPQARAEFERWLTSTYSEIETYNDFVRGRDDWVSQRYDVLAHVHDGCNWCDYKPWCELRRDGALSSQHSSQLVFVERGSHYGKEPE